MSTATLSDLSDLIVAAIAEAAEEPGRLQTIAACLTASLGLTIALHADGDARAASDLCEAASAGVFEQAASHALLVALARGRA